MNRQGNPYMPLWEHVPDGEPRVFTHNGEQRVYVYGSHDTLKNEYCGLDYVVWSAPVFDMSDWKCHGVCFTSRDDQPLFAPDVVKRGDKYYMYVSEARGSKCSVAVSDTPWGPFTDPKDTMIGFDPGVLVDDNGRIYAFWGFCGSNCAELHSDMMTIKDDTYRANPIGHCEAPWARDDGCIDKTFGFFEASSPRKVLGKYVLIYSKNYNTEVPELGVVPNNNGFLSYAYSDEPLSGYVYGGDISFNGGEIIDTPEGKRMTYQWGNNHGSLCEINGQWYIFYHRQTGLDEYSRQAMIEPVDVALSDDGRLFIGKITYENGKPVKSEPVEMTSSGACTEGLDPKEFISAAKACHIYDGKDIAKTDKKNRPYVQPVRKNELESKPFESRMSEDACDVSSPVVNIKDGTTVGFKYLNFGSDTDTTGSINNAEGGLSSCVLRLTAYKDIKVEVIFDRYDNEPCAELTIPESERSQGFDEFTVKLGKPVTGKRAVYFRFTVRNYEPTDPSIAVFDGFMFR